MAVPPQSAKELLRVLLKGRREALVSAMDEADRTRSEEGLASVVRTGLGSGTGTVAAYVPIGSEIDPASCIETLRADGCRIALPRVTGRAAPMTFHLHDADAALVDGPFGLRQPPSDAPECTPDVVLAPLLGFTIAGVRIGYGAGHYDRALAQIPQSRRIGLAWDAQRCETLPEDEWDVRLHAIATPTQWIEA